MRACATGLGTGAGCGMTGAMRPFLAPLAVLLVAAVTAASGAATAGVPGPPAGPAVPGAAPGWPAARPGGRPFPGWLAGTWVMEQGANWGDAVWTSPRGGIMLGLARTGFGGHAETWESSRIQRKPDGSLALVRQVSGGAPVEWAMVLAGADSVEFANALATPQRIRLWREGQLLMIETARLDGAEAVRSNWRPVETAPQD